jgi:hypothetical protein
MVTATVMSMATVMATSLASVIAKLTGTATATATMGAMAMKIMMAMTMVKLMVMGTGTATVMVMVMVIAMATALANSTVMVTAMMARIVYSAGKGNKGRMGWRKNVCESSCTR